MGLRMFSKMYITTTGRKYYLKRKFSGGKERVYSCEKCGESMIGADSYSGSNYCYKCISSKSETKNKHKYI